MARERTDRGEKWRESLVEFKASDPSWGMEKEADLIRCLGLSEVDVFLRLIVMWSLGVVV